LGSRLHSTVYKLASLSKSQRLHSVENPLLDMNGNPDRKLVYRCDGDLVAEFAKCSRPHRGLARYIVTPSSKILQTTRQNRWATAQTSD
jgi:hypothetical protein